MRQKTPLRFGQTGKGMGTEVERGTQMVLTRESDRYIFFFRPILISFIRMYFHSTKSEVRWNVDAHEDNFKFPTVERQPGDVCPRHLEFQYD